MRLTPTDRVVHRYNRVRSDLLNERLSLVRGLSAPAAIPTEIRLANLAKHLNERGCVFGCSLSALPQIHTA